MESEIYIKLLSMNVGQNICPIVESVLGQFINIRLTGPLPSPASAGNLFVFAETQLLAKIQAAVAIVENKNSILHCDEASKYGTKIASYQVTTGRRFFAVGLFDENIGTAERQI